MPKKKSSIAFFLCVLVLAFAAPAHAEGKKPGKTVFEKDGNVFLKARGQSTQLTSTGRDWEPVLSPDGRWVVFSREIEGRAEECKKKDDWICATDQLWIVDLETRSERLLLEPREDARDMKEFIAEFDNKIFSPDSKTIYFNTPAWAVSDAIHAIDTDGENERFVTPGDLVQVVRGPLPSYRKKYLANFLKRDDWRIFPKNEGVSLVRKALKDDVLGHLIVKTSRIKTVSSPIPLEDSWEGDDGKYYVSKGRRLWTELVSPDGSMSIPLGAEIR